MTKFAALLVVVVLNVALWGGMIWLAATIVKHVMGW